MEPATAESYSATADTLVERIKALIPEHPEILEMNDPWALFRVDGFSTKGLDPTLFQAMWALEKAKQEYQNG